MCMAIAAATTVNGQNYLLDSLARIPKQTIDFDTVYVELNDKKSIEENIETLENAWSYSTERSRFQYKMNCFFIYKKPQERPSTTSERALEANLILSILYSVKETNNELNSRVCSYYGLETARKIGLISFTKYMRFESVYPR